MNDVNMSASGERQKWTTYQRYVIAILLIVYTFNFIDRQIIAILSPAIKAELGLSDTQLGLLKGFAFALFYAFFGFPIARLADKKNRVTIISVSVVLWSGMTVLCGAAQNFVQLLLARMGVGVGEAGCNPPAHSLISDYFRPEERATAIGLYSLGISLGTLFGILLGGLIAESFGWRWAFVVVGAPGIILGLIVKLTLKEAKRGGMDIQSATKTVLNGSIQSKEEASPPPPLSESFAIMWRIKSYRILTFSAGLTSFCGFALGLWIVDFLFRTHELTYAELTIPLAMVMGVGGGIGTICGGYLTDKLAKTDGGAYFTLPAYGYLISVPLFIAAMWAGSPGLCFFMFFFVFLLHGSVAGPFYALVQNLAPVKLRAFGAALFFFVLSVLGLGLGPVYLGVLSDVLTPSMGETDALRWALTTLAPVWVAASSMLLWGRKRLRQDLEDIAESDVVANISA